MQMWADYYQMNASRGDLDVVSHLAVEQASRQPPQYDRPTWMQTVSVGRWCLLSERDALTGEVLIVIVGARCRRGVNGCGGGVV